MKVMYYWSEDGIGEPGELTEVVIDKECVCYHCDQPISENTGAVKIEVVDDTYILHTACAIKSCEAKDSLKIEEAWTLSNKTDMQRFIIALENAICHIEKTAKVYSFQDDPTYLQVKESLKNAIEEANERSQHLPL